MLQAMVGDPGAPPPAPAQTRFSADGFWWWDGGEWKPALSQDRLWRWTGSTWEAARPGGAPGSGGGSLGIIVAAVVGVVLLVAVTAVAVIYFAGPQISNVFSNLVTASSSP
jgi:hypothetical protein